MENAVSSDNTVPSSPSVAVFSDEVQTASSPPSSPPGFPWEQAKSGLSTKAPVTAPAKTAFSVLGKRKALESINDNVQPKKRVLAQPRKPSTQNLTQMQISLGQEIAKKCKTCGMEYIQSSTEDRKLHDKYHKQNAEGYDVGKDFIQKSMPARKFRGLKEGDAICCVTHWCRPARKRRGQAVLEIVQRELGAVEIPEKTIWDPGHLHEPDWHTYLYIRGSKCIGFLLTQKIREAYQCVEPSDLGEEPAPREQSNSTGAGRAREALKARQEAERSRLEELSKRPIELAKIAEPAFLGISRIWTSALHRQSGIAKKLLDTAFTAHNIRVAELQRLEAKTRARPDYETLYVHIEDFHCNISKLQSLDAVAFSQPTAAGTELARSWFGKIFGWKVYLD